MKKQYLIVLPTLFYSAVICYAQTSWKVLDSLCYHYNEDKPDTAIILGYKALEGCSKEKGKNSLEYAVCLDHIAWAYKSKNQLGIADSLYQTAVKICQNENKTQTNEYAEVINNLALLCMEQKQNFKAELLLKEAVAIREKVLGKEHLDYVSSCKNLTILYDKQKRYAEAELLFKQLLPVMLKHYGNINNRYAEFCMDLAALYQELGKYNEAEPLMKEVLSIRAKVFGKQTVPYATYCGALGLLYYEQGRYQEAESLYKYAMNIYATKVGKKHPIYGSFCNNLGLLYKTQKRYAKAESLFKEDMQISLQYYGKEHYKYAASCNNMATLYREQKRYKEAEELYNETLSNKMKILGKDDPSYATSCSNLAVLYLAQKRYTEAESLFKEALSIRDKVFGKEHPDYIKSCANLALLYEKKQSYQQAEPLYIKTILMKEKEIEQNFAHLSETEKEQYLQANIDKYFNDFQRFVYLYHTQKSDISTYGYDIALRTKGLILSSSEKIKNRILNSGNTALKELYLEWKNTKDKYNKALNLTIQQRQQKKLNLDSLLRTANEYEKELAQKSLDFAHVFSPKPISWKDIQTKLKKDEAAIEIVRVMLEQREDTADSIAYMALIVKKNSSYPEVVTFPYGNKLEKEHLINHRRSTRHKIYDPYSYDVYWKPLKNILSGINTVYFSSEGVYHQINLATLQNTESKQYVFDEIRIIPVTNTKDLLEPVFEYKNKKSYFIGNPKYNLNIDTKGNERSEDMRSFHTLSPLKGAENEVKKVSRFFENPVLSIGKSATEESAKSIKNPYILHIATHGYFKKGEYQNSVQAMLNAGLLFAGVLDYDKMEIRPFDKEDGKLTAFEVMNMELDSTELVVLSACETGLGQASKEGVYGLQRAFKVAGANSIIMSLWKVSDEATQILMAKFYENWQRKGMDKRKAFETAQKELREEYKEPYYWGAFVMIE